MRTNSALNQSQQTGSISTRKWNQYVPQTEASTQALNRNVSPLSTSMRKKPKIQPHQLAKKDEWRSIPQARPMVERGIAPNNKEQHQLFASVLRDPSPISPERAVQLKSKRGGSRSGAMSARLTAPMSRSISPLNSMNQTWNKSRIEKLIKQEQDKITAECNFKPNLSLTQRYNNDSIDEEMFNINQEDSRNAMKNFSNLKQYWRNQKWNEHKQEKLK